MSAAFRRRHFVAGSPRASGGGEELRSRHREGPLWVESRLSGFHNSLNFARQTDHGFPLTIDFDRPSKPRIESQLSDNHASVAIDDDTIFV